MAVDLHIVRRVGEPGGRLGAIEEDVIGGRLQRRAAIEPVIAEQPEIAGPGDGEAREELKLIREVRVVHSVLQLDAKIDFRRLESDVFDGKVEDELGQLLQMNGQWGGVPGPSIRELVVAQQVSSACR